MRIKIQLLLLLLLTINVNAQWKKTNLPAYAWSLTISGENIFAGTLANGIYRSTNNGANWTEVNSGITIKAIWSVAVLGDVVYVGTKSGGIFRSVDNGNTWTISNSGIPSTAYVQGFSQFGTKIFATTNNSGVYVSNDKGSTWTQHNSGIVGLVALPILATDTDLFVGVGQRVYKYDTVNTKWVSVSSGIPNNTVSSIAYMKNNKNLFAGISSSVNEVVRSVDNGSSWTSADNGIPKVPVATLAAVGTNLFVGNDYGVYLSTNFGTNWSDASTGMTGASYCTFLTPGKTDLYVVYKGDVWKRPLTDFGITSIEKESEEIPTKFDLSQNYPNPFNPETTISYKLQTATQVSLKVYDVLGNEVATLVNEYQQAGSYNSQFSIRNYKLSSGVYFYTLKAGDFSSTKKMILLK